MGGEAGDAREGDLRNYLQAGYRSMTKQRRLLWAVLCSSGGHLTAAELTEKMQRKDPHVNRALVDRVLALYSALGLAYETDPGREDSYWEIVDRGEEFHLICEGCDETRHLTGELMEQVRNQLADGFSFSANRIDLRAFGLCQRCQQAGGSGETTLFGSINPA